MYNDYSIESDLIWTAGTGRVKPVGPGRLRTRTSRRRGRRGSPRERHLQRGRGPAPSGRPPGAPAAGDEWPHSRPARSPLEPRRHRRPRAPAALRRRGRLHAGTLWKKSRLDDPLVGLATRPNCRRTLKNLNEATHHFF